jgi:hypothetical protein
MLLLITDRGVESLIRTRLVEAFRRMVFSARRARFDEFAWRLVAAGMPRLFPILRSPI